MNEIVWESHYYAVRDLTLKDSDYHEGWTDFLVDRAGEDGFHGPASPNDWEQTGYYDRWVEQMIEFRMERDFD